MIRKAQTNDIPVLIDLLYQVGKVHQDARPDLFVAGSKKYTEQEVDEILHNPKTPVFVFEDGEGKVRGYAFCIFQQHLDSHILTDIKTLYIDDLCVDQNCRHQHIGRQLYEYVCAFARENGCYNVTLNVWADNASALRFYQSLDLKVQKIGMEKIL